MDGFKFDFISDDQVWSVFLWKFQIDRYMTEHEEMMLLDFIMFMDLICSYGYFSYSAFKINLNLTWRIRSTII